MNEELFAVTHYCTVHQIDPSFIDALETEGIITVILSNNEKFIDGQQLPDLEIYTRWHHDLGINIEGIDAIRNLLEKHKDVQLEINELKWKLSQYELYLSDQNIS